LLKLLFLLLLSLNLFAQNFKVASYNVENLFDLVKQNSEYEEFIPNTKSNWNKTNYEKKFNNVIKVIKDIDADIIALQEIENKSTLVQLFKKLPQYKYYSFTKYPKSAAGVGFLSKIKIVENSQIDVKFPKKLFRPILETTFELENTQFKIFNNHWPSKAVSESYRVIYAKKLQDRLIQLPKDYDYILLGDFNSNYDEMTTFRNSNKLNNTQGITGINQVLNTTLNNKYITYDDVLKESRKVHYNLWLEIDNKNRFSNKFRGQNQTPDNIILSPALLDTKKISYIPNSFEVFKPDYLYKNNSINRWQMSKDKKHLGLGYSDHLPIWAQFSTSKEDRNPLKPILDEKSNKNFFSISDLYDSEKLVEPVLLNDLTVIYKSNNGAIIKDKNRAIYIYKNVDELKLGYNFDLQINQIKNYNGLKEVIDFSFIQENQKNNNYKNLYLDASKIDILDHKYQNEIVTNLTGKVNKNKLYFDDNKYIKLFATNKEDLPKDGDIIKFETAHLGNYKGNIQILIHSKNDYKVEN
jgi:exonuclease III